MQHPFINQQNKGISVINCMCVIQANQEPDRIRDQLESALSSFTEHSFAEPAGVNWVVVPEGNGFTAGKLSTSSVVSLRANEALDPTRRESLLRSLVDRWTEATGCSVDEIVAVISDPT